MSQEVIDCHQHYFDPANNDFQSFLRSLGVPCYLPEQYIVDSESQLISRTVVSSENDVAAVCNNTFFIHVACRSHA